MKYKLGDITIKNWNDWDRVPRVTAVGTAILNAVGASSLATVSVFGLTTVAAVVGYVAVTLVTSWALKALAPKPPSPQRGLLFNARDAAAPQEIVYGKIRKGGYITYAETTGDGNKYLHQFITLAGHEVNAINKIYVYDEEVTLESSAGGFVTDDRWKDDDDNSKLYIFKFTGLENFNVSQFINNISGFDGPEWKVDGVAPSGSYTDFKGEGIACLYVRLEYDTNVFADGIPLITAEVEGKKVYDPRTGTTAHSANAALCIRDYLTSTYGLDNDGDTDDAASASFEVAADACDEDVTLSGGGTEKRYEINGVITLDRTPSDILGDMMTACAGTLFWGAGKWHLKVGEYISPVKTFTLDDLRSEINLQTKHSRRDNFNIVRGTFIDAENRYIQADYPEIRSETFISDDSDVESALDLALPLTTSSAMAQRLAKMTLFRGREQMTLTADFGLEAFEVECGDIISLTIDRYGFSAKDFEVVGWKFKNDGDAGDLRVALTLRETSSAAFSWTAEEADITSNNSTLPDPRAGLTISNLAVSAQNTNITSDGTHTVTASLGWDAVDSAYVNHYLVGYKNNATGIFAKSTTNDNTFETGLLIDGDSYTFVVAAVTDAGYVGAQASVTFTAEADTTAPSAPTSISATGGFRQNVVNWTNPTDNDFKEVDVYANTSNTSSGATLIGTASGTEFVHGGLAESTTRYYFLKAKDYTGNASGFSTGASGTTLADPATGADGADGADGDDGVDGDTVIAGKVYYTTLQSSAPSTPSATSYNVSTASFTGLTSGWSLDQPSVSITDTSVQEWSSNFTVTISGVDASQTIVFTSPSGAIQVTADLESDNYDGAGFDSSGTRLTPHATQGWHIDRSSGSAEFQNAIIRGTLVADDITSGTLDADNVTVSNLNASNINAGTLNAERLNLTGSQLQNSSGALIVSSGGINTAEIASAAVTDVTTAQGSSTSVSTSETTILSANVTAVNQEKFLVVGSIGSGTKSQVSTYYALRVKSAGATFVSGILLQEYFSNFIGSKFITGIVTATSTGTLTFSLTAQAFSSIATETVTTPKLAILRLKDA